MNKQNSGNKTQSMHVWGLYIIRNKQVHIDI